MRLQQLFYGAVAFALAVDTSIADLGSSLLSKRQQQIRISGAQNTGVVGRRPVEQMMSQDPDAFNMFLCGLRSMQRMDESNPLSYYQISGIHGRPFIPWEQANSPNFDYTTGYCTHNSALFPTWHRPYLALMEQEIVAHALQLASQYSDSNTRQRWTNAARRCRIPYWDWAGASLQSSIPQFIRTPKISITEPVNGKPSLITVPNPFYEYIFTNKNYLNQYFDGSFQTMAATRRCPTPDNRFSQNDIANAQMTTTYQSRRQNTFNLYSIPDFNSFGNTAYQPGNSPIQWTSVESIHNDIHVNVGGNGGDMSLIDYSSFDPIFWTHHCMIDRLTAIYQAIYPGRTLQSQQASGTFARQVQQGDVDDINTPLQPFINSQGQFFTTAQLSSASSIWGLNYDYPEVPVRFRGGSAQDLSNWAINSVNSMYGSGNSGSKKVKRQAPEQAREWICHIVFEPAQVPGQGESPQCLVFLGQPNPNPLVRTVEPSLIGSAAAFGKQVSSASADMKITATVPLSHALSSAGIDTSDVKACVSYLKENLLWTIQRGDTKVSLDAITSLVVGVSSAIVEAQTENQLPKWGEFETYYETTQDKVGGMTLSQSHIIRSIDVSHVLSNAPVVPASQKLAVDVGLPSRMAGGYKPQSTEYGQGKASNYDAPSVEDCD